MSGFEADSAFIKDFCQWAGLTPSAVAKRIGVAATTLLRPFKGTATTRLSQPTLDKMRARFPDYPGWYRQPADQHGMARLRPDPHERPGEIVYVRSVEISLAIGGGAVVEEHPVTELVPFNPNFLRTVTNGPFDKLVIMNGHGESMEPTLLRSDTLMFDTANRLPVLSDCIWAINYADGGMIRRLRRIEVEKQQRYMILSDNPAVPPQVAAVEEVHVIGKLIWVGRRM